MVPHRGTNWAAPWLTSQIGRDAVLSRSYGRGYYSRHTPVYKSISLYPCHTQPLSFSSNRRDADVHKFKTPIIWPNTHLGMIHRALQPPPGYVPSVPDGRRCLKYPFSPCLAYLLRVTVSRFFPLYPPPAALYQAQNPAYDKRGLCRGGKQETYDKTGEFAWILWSLDPLMSSAGKPRVAVTG